MAEHLAKGEEAEQLARHHLEKQGLKWIESNYRTKHGEIDLIMQDRVNLVFVEVRYRRNDRFGRASESVTPAKQRKLIATASHYLMKYRKDTPCRFDIIGITDNREGTSIEWVRDAFQSDY
jgi:putative endonuclease